MYTLLYRPLWFHVAGLQETRTGYGSRLRTPYMLDYKGYRRRLYAICWSNAATYYVNVKGKREIIPSHLLKRPE